jgi:hypothetical protein
MRKHRRDEDATGDPDAMWLSEPPVKSAVEVTVPAADAPGTPPYEDTWESIPDAPRERDGG